MTLPSSRWRASSSTKAKEAAIHVSVSHQALRALFHASRRSSLHPVSTTSGSKWLRHADPHIIAIQRSSNQRPVPEEPLQPPPSTTLHLTSLLRLIPDLLLHVDYGRCLQGPFFRSLMRDSFLERLDKRLGVAFSPFSFAAVASPHQLPTQAPRLEWVTMYTPIRYSEVVTCRRDCGWLLREVFPDTAMLWSRVALLASQDEAPGK